jgi:hypothetical protein
VEVSSFVTTEELLQRESAYLLKYGDAVLKGDFAVFAELEPRVKSEQRRWPFLTKWGDKAREYGWTL